MTHTEVPPRDIPQLDMPQLDMPQLQERVTDLEVRLTHQDASIEELTRVILAQEKVIKQLREELSQIKRNLKDISDPLVRPEAEETPPPHY